MIKQPTEQLATFPLLPIVRDLLRMNEGQEPQHFVTISEPVAEVLYLLCNNKHTCHVQFPSDDDVDIVGKPITQPILWEIGAWLNSSERWLRQKMLSKKRIDDYNVRQANINRIARSLVRQYEVHPDAARMLAHRWMERKDLKRIEVIAGVKKLYERAEDI